MAAIKVASIQISPELLKDCTVNPFLNAFNLDDAQQKIRERFEIYAEKLNEAGKAGVNLVVTVEDMPGLSLCGTFLDEPDTFTSLVKYSDKYYSEKLSKLAEKWKMFIVACYFGEDQGNIYNKANLFGSKGELVGSYRKVHLPAYEQWLVTAGQDFPVFKTDIGNIAMLICYDDNCPEAAACCALNGADIICHPTLMPPREFRALTRALDNQLHYIYSARKSSLIVGPDEKILANAGDEKSVIISAKIEFEDCTLDDELFYNTLYSGIQDRRKRLLNDRQPEAYTVLTADNKKVLLSRDEIEKIYAVHKDECIREYTGKKCKYTWTARKKN